MARHQQYRSNRMKKREYLKYFLEHVTPYHDNQKHLTGSDLRQNVRYFKVHTEMKVFKKVEISRSYWSTNEAIASLSIPVGTIIHHRLDCLGSIDTRKCRASKAFVKQIYDLKEHKISGNAHSSWDTSFKYRTGRSVVPDRAFWTDRWDSTCASGIHFFLQVNDALDYN